MSSNAKKQEGDWNRLSIVEKNPDPLKWRDIKNAPTGIVRPELTVVNEVPLVEMEIAFDVVFPEKRFKTAISEALSSARAGSVKKSLAREIYANFRKEFVPEFKGQLELANIEVSSSEELEDLLRSTIANPGTELKIDLDPEEDVVLGNNEKIKVAKAIRAIVNGGSAEDSLEVPAQVVLPEKEPENSVPATVETEPNAQKENEENGEKGEEMRARTWEERFQKARDYIKPVSVDTFKRDYGIKAELFQSFDLRGKITDIINHSKNYDGDAHTLEEQEAWKNCNEIVAAIEKGKDTHALIVCDGKTYIIEKSAGSAGEKKNNSQENKALGKAEMGKLKNQAELITAKKVPDILEKDLRMLSARLVYSDNIRAHAHEFLETGGIAMFSGAPSENDEEAREHFGQFATVVQKISEAKEGVRYVVCEGKTYEIAEKKADEKKPEEESEGKTPQELFARVCDASHGVFNLGLINMWREGYEKITKEKGIKEEKAKDLIVQQLQIDIEKAAKNHGEQDAGNIKKIIAFALQTIDKKI